MFGNNNKIEDKITNEEVKMDNSYYPSFNKLRNLLREKQKDGLTGDEKDLLNKELNNYLKLKESILGLQDSLNFDISFDSKEENEFSNLLVDKIISNFSVENENNNLDLVIEKFLILLKEINEGEYENNGVPIKQGDIENSQILGYGRNGEIQIGDVELKFHIDNKKGTITFFIEKGNIIKEYSFVDNINYEKNKISDVDKNKDIIKKEKYRGKKDQKEVDDNLVYDELTLNDQKSKFSNFLSTKSLGKFQRGSPLGRFLRTFRYIDNINNLRGNVPTEFLFSLIMQESYGDPLSINSTPDGGAGILHFQPGTAKWMGLKLFSENEPYKEYDSNKTGKDLNHGQGLLKLMADNNNDLSKLSKLDDRFNIDKCIKAGANYLKKIYNGYRISNDDIRNKNTKGQGWGDKDNTEEFKWMLALNGYNKGNNVYRNFTGTHITGLKGHIGTFKLYQKKLDQGIIMGLSGDLLLNYINGKGEEENNQDINIRNEYLVNSKSHALKIIAFQNAMKNLGYFPENKRPNGVYGEVTKNSVKRLQLDLGVNDTGMYDKNTAIAVANFQKKHLNLSSTKYYGKLGPGTIKKMKTNLVKNKGIELARK